MEPATPHGNLALDAAADTPTLFGQTMGLVAATTGLFALGAYLGRNVSDGWAWVSFIGPSSAWSACASPCGPGAARWSDSCSGSGS